jgi:hypothetical protein
MKSLQHTIPEDFRKLDLDGFWPHKGNELRQNLSPIIPKSEIRKFAPEEENLYLYPFPLLTIAQEAEHNDYWYDPRNALHEIEPSKALILGDFGLGSDTAIILDYREKPPVLLRLQWGKDENHWVPLGISTSEFSKLIRENHNPEQVG